MTLALDMSHLVSRLGVNAPSGIERTDLAFGRHFIRSPRLACGVQFGLFKPHGVSLERARGILAALERRDIEAPDRADEPAVRRLRDWLAAPPAPASGVAQVKAIRAANWTAIATAGIRWRHRLKDDAAFRPPNGATYLNVGQHALEIHWLYRWLDSRPDLKKVFLVHDLLPLDYPEYFRPGYRQRFARRVETIARHATHILVTTTVVRDRVDRELNRAGARRIPIHVQPLPSPVSSMAAPSPLPGAVPYFVVLGSIEPRKNHLLLLHVWRDLAAMSGACPRLVIIGNLGWENEQVVDLLERSTALAPHVLRISNLSSAGLRAVLGGARGLLMPSFAEGYGIPLVEALSMGVPAIASDIAVFHEVAQGCATYVHPLDGPGWRRAILDLAGDAGSERARAQAARFRAPTPESYFAAVEAFLDGI